MVCLESKAYAWGRSNSSKEQTLQFTVVRWRVYVGRLNSVYCTNRLVFWIEAVERESASRRSNSNKQVEVT